MTVIKYKIEIHYSIKRVTTSLAYQMLHAYIRFRLTGTQEEHDEGFCEYGRSDERITYDNVHQV